MVLISQIDAYHPAIVAVSEAGGNDVVIAFFVAVSEADGNDVLEGVFYASAIRPRFSNFVGVQVKRGVEHDRYAPIERTDGDASRNHARHPVFVIADDEVLHR